MADFRKLIKMDKMKLLDPNKGQEQPLSTIVFVIILVLAQMPKLATLLINIEHKVGQEISWFMGRWD